MLFIETASLVETGKYDEAVSKYKRMVNILKDHYGIDEMILNYDMTQGGHGKVKLIERKGEI